MSRDTAPIFQQDRHGVYWLVWVSKRGAKAQRDIWMASSPDGVEWSFRRKVEVPQKMVDSLAGWRHGRTLSVAFSIDHQNVFWMIVRGWLLKSDDGVTWRIDSELSTGGTQPDHVNTNKYYHLSNGPGDRQLIMTNRQGTSRGAELWGRTSGGVWKPIDQMTEKYLENAGTSAFRSYRSMVAVTSHGSDLYVHKFDEAGDPIEPVIVESYLTKPYHPALTPLPDGRWLVAFGSNDGIVAAVFDKEN
jgi:hypothetical protein